MPQSNKQDVNLPFPVNGVFEARPHDQQPERTTTDAKNVLSFDIGEDRQRGGRRLGTTKATPAGDAGGGLPDNRVQMMDVVPLGGDALGYPGGIIKYNNSADDGVPAGTPADLTELALDPNQDGNQDDALGVDDPTPISGNQPLYPIDMYELTQITPKPTNDDWDDNAWQYYDGGGEKVGLVPRGEAGPIPSNDAHGSPGLWHVRTVDEKQGCIFPRAPFDKVTGNNDGNEEYNQYPSKFLVNNRTDAPLGFMAGGSPVFTENAQDPTNSSGVCSVLFPFQADDENSYHSGTEKTWAVSCDIRTPADDSWPRYSGDNRVRYRTNPAPGVTGTVHIFGKFHVTREYYYGLVFRVKAAVTPEVSTIDAADDDDKLLFVGFEQTPNTNGNTGQTPSLSPKLKIGTIKNNADNAELIDFAALDTLLSGGVQRKHWYNLDVRCSDNKLEVRLDGSGPLAADNSGETQFDLETILGTDTAGQELSISRARSGLLFKCRSFVAANHVRASSGGSGADYVDNIRIASGSYNNSKVNDFAFSSWASAGPTTSNYYPNGANQDSSTHNFDPQGDHGTWGHCRMAWVGDGTDTYNDVTATHYRLFFRDQDANDPGQVSISYPDEYNADGYTSGHFHGQPTGDNGAHQDGWSQWITAAQIQSRAEWGGDFVRDWNEPFFHNFQWKNMTDLTELDRVLLAADDGKVYISHNSGGSFTQSVADDTNDDQDNIVFDSTSARVGGVEFFNQYYMTDGTKYLSLDVSNRKLYDWSILTQADGSSDDYLIPGGANSDTVAPKCKLIARHMGRIVLAGYSPYPNNWFMSGPYTDSTEAGNGPNDWDVVTGEAVSGTSTNLSEIGEPIKALFPFREESIVFGCLNSILLLQGDPAEADSSIVSISRDIGVIGPDAWAHGPNRSLFFFGTNGLYYLAPNEFNVSQTNRLSLGRMDREFASIDLASFDVKLLYDYYLYGLHIFMSAKNSPGGSEPTRHYFYDERSQALWPMEYPATHGPAACVYYPDPSPTKRRVLMGGFDGHVRYFDPAATSDDGTAIESHVWIGPFQVGPITEAKVMRMAAVLDAQSPDVTWGIYVGDTAEEAMNSTAIATGSWSKGRNLWKHVRARGQNIFVKLSSDSATDIPWSLEHITATLAVAGRVRERN